MSTYFCRKFLSSLCIVLFMTAGYGQQNVTAEQSKNYNLEQAGKYYEKGNYGKASNYLKNLFKQPSATKQDWLKGHFLMGLCLDKRNKYSESKHHFKIALNKGYTSGKIENRSLKIAKAEIEMYGRAFSRYADDDFEGSGKLLLNLLDRNLYKKDRIEPLILYGRVLVRLENNIAGRKIFTQILKIDKRFNPVENTLREDELELFLRTKQRYNKFFWSGFKRNWVYFASGAAAVAVIGVIASSGGDDGDPMTGETEN